MQSTAKTRKFPLAIDIVMMMLVFVVTQMLVGLVLNVLGVVAPEISPLGEEGELGVEAYVNSQEALGRYNAWVFPLIMVASMGAMWLYIRLRAGKGSLRIRHAAAGLNPTIVLVGVAWLLSSQILLEPLLALLPEEAPSSLGLGVWACFTAVVTAPILEELLCRGLILETLHRRWGRVVSIFGSAIFFGLLHFDLSTMIVAVVAGIIFGMLYLRTSSIFTTIIIHSLNNLIAFALINFGKEEMTFSEMVGGGSAYYILYGVAAAIFVVASVESFFRVFKPRRRGERAVEQTPEKTEKQI